MNRREASTPGEVRQGGFTLFELILVIIIVAVFSGVLLDRFVRYQALAERAAMERTVASIRAALNLNMAALIVKGRQQEIPRLAQINPFQLLDDKQANYVGEYFDTPEGLAAGTWYYDLKRRETVYTVKFARGLHTAAGENNEIRFRTVLLRNTFLDAGAEEAGIGAIGFQPRATYRWEVP